MRERDYSASRPDLAVYPEPPFWVLGLTQEEWVCLQLAMRTGFQRISGTGVGTWDAKSPPQAQQKLSTQKVSLVCAEEKTFLSRGWSKFLEVILTGKEIFKETPDNPCCLVYHMPSIQPTFLLDTRSMFITQLSYSSSPKCYPNAMICPEYLFAQQREKLKMTDTSNVASCAVERHWKEEIYIRFFIELNTVVIESWNLG